ncbi:proline-rich protein 5-like [Alosa sapidissima]|uniref:proline-rich protein 5-like n=1 Tax=Alosa sapidissima TaxID=34773 RepID=UPI001C08A42D|nr:proline-rich protein 5-like [Alosa sapidissima]XP_041916970.1 proline-rich protein 5-like [Alosa sapidissima]XP_041916971.1 proline-rich protein 5-like [Alosa sapidissima]
MSKRQHQHSRLSAPTLSSLPRAPQSPSTSVMNSVCGAVIKVFQGEALQTNELHALMENIRWLLKTEMGSFITEYFQNQLINKGLAYIAAKLQGCEGDRMLLVLSETWEQFFTEILPTLQAIFSPLQGQELTVREMALLSFRDLVLMKLPLHELLPQAPILPLAAITQMLLVLQGVHEPRGLSLHYCKLENLIEMVITPYLKNCLHKNHTTSCTRSARHSRVAAPLGPPEIQITQYLSDSSLLDPLLEQEGEVYLERMGTMRRHTVANAHSDAQLLTVPVAGSCVAGEPHLTVAERAPSRMSNTF